MAVITKASPVTVPVTSQMFTNTEIEVLAPGVPCNIYMDKTQQVPCGKKRNVPVFMKDIINRS